MAGHDTKLKLTAIKPESPCVCDAHKTLVEVLLALDKRQGRMEIILLVAAAATVGSFGRDIVLPLLAKIAGL
jgi:hypothetical protein